MSIMASTPTEAGVTSKQLINVIWKRGGIEVPYFVGLGISKYRRQTSEYYNENSLQRHHPQAALPLSRPGMSPGLTQSLYRFQLGFQPPEKSPEHDVYSPRPVFTRAGTATALHGTEVYFSVSTHGYDCPSSNRDLPGSFRMPHYVWKYNCVEEECSIIKGCLDVHDFGLAVHDFGLAVVNEQLVVVGGETDQIDLGPDLVSPQYRLTSMTYRTSQPSPLWSASSYIAVLDLNQVFHGWQYDYFPPMSKPRKHPAALCVEQYLVVAGGQGDNDELLSLVEVLNTENKVWSQVTSLPEPVRSLTTALCGNQVYFLGGFGSNGSIRSVFMCPVESIKQFCDGTIERAVVWQKACDTPLFRSSCVVYNDELFAVGGRTPTYRPSSGIYCYNSNLDSWNLVDQQLPTPRSLPIALAAKNKLVVIGGLVQDDEPTDIVEIGTCISDPTLNMKNLLICLNAVDNWKMLGLQLNISNGELTRLEGANQSNPDLCKENMLKLWLCKEGNPSWMTLASALEDINLRIPASKIRTKYLQQAADDICEESVTDKSTADVDAAPSPSKPQAASKPSPAVAYRPTMPELISMKKRDGARGTLKIIAWITAHKLTQCVDFAHKLLIDPLTVKTLCTDYMDDKEGFVRAVLQRWINRDDGDDDEESLPCTWETLITSSRDASLDGEFVRLLRDNLPK